MPLQQTLAPGGPANDADRSSRWVIVAILIYGLLTLALLPVASLKGPVIPGITPLVVGGMLATDLSTSFLLFVWVHEDRTGALLVLACTYLWSGLMAVLHLLTFPGGMLAAGSILGTEQAGAWPYLLWTSGYAALTFVAIMLEVSARDRRIAPAHVPRAIALGIGAALTTALAAAFTTVVLGDRLPPIIVNGSWSPIGRIPAYVAQTVMTASVAIGALVAGRKNALFLWLALAITAMLAASFLTIYSGSRYTLGWSIGRLNWVLSACALLIFFLRNFRRQQRLLIDAKDTLEHRVTDRTAQLTEAVQQRDLLLREVYHRVKNNLMVVDAMIAMESVRISDPNALEILAALRDRIMTLGMVHQQLMLSEDLRTFSIAGFLQELSDRVAASSGAADNGVSVVVEAEPVLVNLDFAIPVGLLTTELLSNAIKHANASRITVEFRRENGAHAILVVSDNGLGLDAGRARLAPRIGIGSKIIDGFTRQLGARVEVFQEHGTQVEITIPLPDRV